MKEPILIWFLTVAIALLSSVQAVGYARGSVTKLLDSKSLTVSLASNGKVLPELLSWAPALNCIKMGPRYEPLTAVFDSMPMHTTYSCHLNSDYDFIACPELMKGDETSPKFALNTDNKIALKSQMKQESSGFWSSKPKKYFSSQKCDNLIEFQYNDGSSWDWIPLIGGLFSSNSGDKSSFSRQFILSSLSTVVAAVLFFMYSSYYKKLNVKSKLKKQTKVVLHHLKKWAEWLETQWRKLPFVSSSKKSNHVVSRGRSRSRSKRREEYISDDSESDSDPNFHFDAIDDYLYKEKKSPYIRGKNRSFSSSRR